MHTAAFSDISTLLAAILPYQWVITFFVLAPPPPFDKYHQKQQQQNRHRFYNTCYHLIYSLYAILLLLLSFWCAYVNNIFIGIVALDWKVDSITRLLSTASYVAVAAVQAIMQLSSLLGHRQLCKILTKIAQLEEDIGGCRRRRHSADCSQKQQFSFNAAVATFHWRLASRSGVLLIFLLILMPLVDYKLVDHSMPLNVKLWTVYFGLLIQIKSIEYCIFVQLVHELLLQLKRDLLQLHHEIFTLIEDGDGAGARIMHHLLCVDLQANQHLLARIWNLVLSIENYFAIPMMVLFLYNGLNITHTMNWTYLKFDDDTSNAYRFSYTAMIIVNMLLPCWVSQSCIDVYNQFGAILHNLKSHGSNVALSMRLQEYSLQLMQQRMLFTCGGYFDINLKYFGAYNQFGAILHNLKSHGSDVALNMRLQEYSLQLMQQRMLFTCGGFFDINLKNFGAMILTITTYVVILIQFKLQAGTEAQRQHEHNN